MSPRGPLTRRRRERGARGQRSAHMRYRSGFGPLPAPAAYCRWCSRTVAQRYLDTGCMPSSEGAPQSCAGRAGPSLLPADQRGGVVVGTVFCSSRCPGCRVLARQLVKAGATSPSGGGVDRVPVERHPAPDRADTVRRPVRVRAVLLVEPGDLLVGAGKRGHAVDCCPSRCFVGTSSRPPTWGG